MVADKPNAIVGLAAEYPIRLALFRHHPTPEFKSVFELVFLFLGLAGGFLMPHCGSQTDVFQGISAEFLKLQQILSRRTLHSDVTRVDLEVVVLLDFLVAAPRNECALADASEAQNDNDNLVSIR